MMQAVNGDLPEYDASGNMSGCPAGTDCTDQGDRGTFAAFSDERFDLLADLKFLMIAYLSEALKESKNSVLSPTMTGLLAVYLDDERDGIADLRDLGVDAGLAIAAPPRIDLAQGFADLGKEAGIGSFDPFVCESSLLTGALVMNSLSQAVIAAWLCESDFVGWREVLLRMLANDSRFEGMLNGAMYFLGPSAEDRARELRALICGPFVKMGTGERLWSFSLLRMAIVRLACGGQGRLAGGFFPEGMSGSAR